jgi:hypothetical protein
LSRRVVLIVPDAVPLISLGHADRLDLLLVPGLPIWIPDQVYYEVTRDPDRCPDAARVAAFIANNASTVHVFNTVVGSAAAAQRAAGPAARQRGLGEAAIAEFLARLDEVLSDPSDPVMLLFEDGDVLSKRFALSPNVHAVSTRSLLMGMQQRGLLGSADAIWQSIRGAGRRPAVSEIDTPATLGGAQSQW